MLSFICAGIFFLRPPSTPLLSPAVMVVAVCCVVLTLYSRSSDALALGKCQPLLLTFLLFRKRPKAMCSHRLGEPPDSLPIAVVMYWLHIRILMSVAQACPRG